MVLTSVSSTISKPARYCKVSHSMTLLAPNPLMFQLTTDSRAGWRYASAMGTEPGPVPDGPASSEGGAVPGGAPVPLGGLVPGALALPEDRSF